MAKIYKRLNYNTYKLLLYDIFSCFNNRIPIISLLFLTLHGNRRFFVFMVTSPTTHLQAGTLMIYVITNSRHLDANLLQKTFTMQ